MALILRNVAPGRLDEPALIDERGVLSWREVDQRLNRATNGLCLSVPQDRRIGVFSLNCAEAVLAYVAALGAGRSAVPINSHLSAGELAYILADGQIDLLFTGPECLEAACGAVAQAGHGEIVAWRCPETPGVAAWEDWLARFPDKEPPCDIVPQAPMNYTSGTTGRPKAVATPPALFPDCATVGALFDELGEQLRATFTGPGLACSPLYHASPMRLVRAFAGGAMLVTHERFDAEAVLAAIAQYRIERGNMVPTHFRRLLALDEATRSAHDVSSLRFITHTGAACPPDVKRRMIEWFGPVFTEIYGATESGAVATITSEETLAHPGSVGRAVPPFEALILGEDGERLPAGREGRLYFRDTTGRGIIYANDPEKTRAAHIAPGVFTLGEVGYLDEDGYIFITDRSADMIVSGGVNIYPAEAEQVLQTHPAVFDAAVIGVPNTDMGEEVKALVMLKPEAEPPQAAELDRHCRASLAGYKCPRSYEFVETLGRSAMGKINKRDLRAPYWPTARTIG